jgi:hypothetical protein
LLELGGLAVTRMLGSRVPQREALGQCPRTPCASLQEPRTRSVATGTLTDDNLTSRAPPVHPLTSRALPLGSLSELPLVEGPRTLGASPEDPSTRSAATGTLTDDNLTSRALALRIPERAVLGRGSLHTVRLATGSLNKERGHRDPDRQPPGIEDPGLPQGTPSSGPSVGILLE